MLLPYYLAVVALMMAPGLIFERRYPWVQNIGYYSIAAWGALTAVIFLLIPKEEAASRHIIDLWRCGLLCFIMMLFLALLADSIRTKAWQHWTLYALWLVASCGCAKLLITYVK